MNKLTVVGIGPGAADQMTLRAMRALQEADVIAGYGVYVDLVRPLFPDKETLVTPMRREAERCRMAIAAAMEGRHVAMISSGDAGVYGMAGLIYELSQGMELTIEVVPGHQPVRPAHALGDHRASAGRGGLGGFLHRHLQSLQRQARGLSAPRLRDPAAP